MSGMNKNEKTTVDCHVRVMPEESIMSLLLSQKLPLMFLVVVPCFGRNEFKNKSKAKPVTIGSYAVGKKHGVFVGSAKSLLLITHQYTAIIYVRIS